MFLLWLSSSSRTSMDVIRGGSVVVKRSRKSENDSVSMMDGSDAA